MYCEMDHCDRLSNVMALNLWSLKKRYCLFCSFVLYRKIELVESTEVLIGFHCVILLLISQDSCLIFSDCKNQQRLASPD